MYEENMFSNDYVYSLQQQSEANYKRARRAENELEVLRDELEALQGELAKLQSAPFPQTEHNVDGSECFTSFVATTKCARHLSLLGK